VSSLRILNHAVQDQRAWQASSLADRSSWVYPLPSRCRDALDETLRQFRRQPQPATEVRVDQTACAACAEDLRPVHDALEAGPGFAIIEGPTPVQYSPQELQVGYWLVGQLLGRPVAQNVQGTLLYDVRDTGQDVRYGARFSVTNAESTFHTDNSFGSEVADYVGLLCLNTAQAGGLSQIVSAFAVHNEMLASHPDILEVLYRPFHFDRRGGVQPGETPTARFPILSWDGRGLLCRYLRYWIETGHEKAAEPLTAEQVRALDVFDSVLGEPALRVEFALKPGDLFFVNNRWILHNRTAFTDHPEPARRRHLVRLWLRKESAPQGFDVSSAGVASQSLTV
jgi:alpha-ketoglutarate-dependent taurine dioxygenase